MGILPNEAFDSLKTDLGDGGLQGIKNGLCNIRVQDASAWSKQDEDCIKSEIERTIGYAKVNDAVKVFLSNWIVGSFQEMMKNASRTTEIQCTAKPSNVAEQLATAEQDLARCRRLIAQRDSEIE